MKITMEPAPGGTSRGDEVRAGNVYTNAHTRYFKIALAVVERDRDRRPWNNVVFLHVEGGGRIIGCSTQPQDYVREHQDLVGRVAELPDLKVEWR